MSYDFSFNNKTLSFLLGGMAFVGIMLFVAGLLVGASWKEETPTPVAALWQQDSLRARVSQQSVSPQPVLLAEASRPTAAAAAAAPNEAAAPGEVAAPSITATPAKQAHSTPLAMSSEDDEDESERAPISQADGDDVRVIQRADAPAAPAPEDLNKASALSYSVQVGVFLDANNANLMARDLQDKGYTPIVLKATDDQSRVWHAVRIGAYMNKTAAMQAAAGIARQEKLKVIVRPLGSL
jgi:cell division septation protein DedD